MKQLFVNNFATTVAATFGIVDTLLSVTSVVGLPAIGVDEYIALTVFRQTGVEEREHEVLHVTSIAGNVLTTVRAVEGAAASQFLAGDKIEARVTAGALADKVDAAVVTAALALKADAAATTVALDLKADITAVASQIAALVASAPSALDTLDELAAALGDDANFAATVTTALGLKAVSTTLAAVGGAALIGNTAAGNIAATTVQAAINELDTEKASLAANTFTGAQNYADQQNSRAMLIDCGYTFLDKGDSGTSTQTLDYTAGSHQKITATGNHTIAASNWPPTGNLGELLLELVNGGAYTLTWPTISWIKPDGTTTTSISTYLAANTGRVALASSGTDFILFWSRDAGTTIFGKLV